MKFRPPNLLKQPRKLLTLLLPLALFAAGWYFGLPPRKGAGPSAAESSGEVWTCSMHPQIRQPNPGLCPICEMDLIPLKNESGGGLREVAVTPEASALLDLKVSPVVRSPATARVSLFGKVAHDERRLSTITSRVGGRIDRLYVDFTGARVRKNDHLAELYSPEILVAQRELIEATKALRAGAHPSSDAVDETRQRLLAAAREKLRLLQLSESQIDDIATQKAPSDHITIRSPQNGIVVVKFVNEGQYVKTGERLFQVADLSHVWLELEAYESDLPWVRYGQKVTFEVEALPGEQFEGRVAFIEPEINPVTRVTKVRLNVENKKLQLKPGMFARARVQALVAADGKVIDPGLAGKWISPMHPEIVKDAPGKCDLCGMDLVPAEELGFVAESNDSADLPLLVPASAVLRTGERAVVYVRLPEMTDPVFEGREIVIGPQVGDHFMVRSGLTAGELVVTQGAFKLDSELQIKAKPSMMNPNAGLEERPAHEAPADLAGQWPPFLRALGRFQEHVRQGNLPEARHALASMTNALQAVSQNTFQPETGKLWREFSNRLLNAIAAGGEELVNEPTQTLAMLRRTTEEAGRYLGLPARPIVPQPGEPEVISSLKALFDSYLPLSQALARDDPKAAAQAATHFATSAGQPALPEEANPMQQASQAIAATEDIDQQRIHFQKISNLLIALIRQHALDQIGNAYVVHCPMAFDDIGGDWLSSRPEVLNPYFGDTMLRCGSITATLSLDLPTTDSEGPDRTGRSQNDDN